jgi:hypothetical protein
LIRVTKNEFRIIEIIGLPVLITIMLLFAVCYPAALAQNLSSMNNYSNNSRNTATPNSSAKTIVIPQGNKVPITTANSVATDKSNNVQAGSNRTGFANISNLVIKDKTFPIKYNITNGKLLGIIGDKDKTTLVLLLGSNLDNGKLTVELPRNVLDAKSQGNTDAKYNIKIDNKDVDYKEVGTNLNARILQIDFGKNDRMIEITGTEMTS